MSIQRTGNNSKPDDSLPNLPEPIQKNPLAPNWSGPTEGNGTSEPRGELHIALIARNAKIAKEIQDLVYAVTPPLWKGGKVMLHVIISKDLSYDEAQIKLAMADLGLADAKELGITKTDADLGYPSGDNE